MSDDRMADLAVALRRWVRSERRPGELCAACRDHLGAAGAGITLTAGANTSQLCSADARTAQLEERQFMLGEGPSVDALTSWDVIVAADLASDHDRDRWPSFAEQALRTGVHAVFAFPLRMGAARLGVLTVYRESAGPTREAVAAGSRAATLLTRTIFDMQARAVADLTAEVLADGLGDGGDTQAVVHQAAGMISVQLGMGITESLVRLRSHAYASNRSVADVAEDVVTRRQRLQP